MKLNLLKFKVKKPEPPKKERPKNIAPKNRKVIIGDKTFQLIGPNGERSKQINLKQKPKWLELTKKSKSAIAFGVDGVGWKHKGTETCLFIGDTCKASRIRFIKHMKLNKEKNKRILIVGPAKGQEVKYIKDNIENTTIDTFDIIDAIDEKHRHNIKQQIIDPGGIENYINKDLIGKYDGITAVYSAGYWTYYPERNLLKMALMLAPGGVAVISIKNDPQAIFNKLNKIFKRFKLDKQYKIKKIDKSEFAESTDIVIKRK